MKIKITQHAEDVWTLGVSKRSSAMYIYNLLERRIVRLRKDEKLSVEVKLIDDSINETISSLNRLYTLGCVLLL